MSRALTLRVLQEQFAIARLEAREPVPEWVGGSVTCIARTPGELSILCEEQRVPEAVRANRSWRCFEVAGPLDFSEVGILSDLTAALRDAGISVFVFSTFDTDYLLVRSEALAGARTALERAGHVVEG